MASIWLKKLIFTLISFLLLPLLLISCAELSPDAKPPETQKPSALIEVFLSRDPEPGESPFAAAEVFGEGAEPLSRDPKPDAGPSPILTAAETQANAFQFFFTQLKDPSLTKGLAVQGEVKDPLVEEWARAKNVIRMSARGIEAPSEDKAGPPESPSGLSLYFAGAEARDRETLLQALGEDEIGALTCGPPAGDRRVVSLSGFLQAAAKKAAEFLKLRGEGRVSVLASPTPYGESGKRLFLQAARERGLEILSEAVIKGDGLETPLDLKKEVPLVIFAEGLRAVSLLKTLREMGYQGLILFGPAVPHPDLTFDTLSPWSSSLFLKEAGEAAEGVLAVAHKLLVADALPKKDPQAFLLRKFREEYEVQFRSSPSLLSACTYDALLFAAETIRAVVYPLEQETLPSRVYERLRNTPSWSGVLGTYTFRGEASGERVGELSPDAFILVRAEGGRWKPVR